MSGRGSILLLLASLAVAGCSLAGDITPPPDLATAQAAPAVSPPLVPESGQPFLPPQTAPDLTSGKALYSERCAPCHGPTGLGDGPQASALSVSPTALGSLEISQAATGAVWYDVVTRGRIERFMPPFVSLSDQQRWDVVAYALALGTPDQALQAGAAVYDEQCATCHGDRGQGGEVGPALNEPTQLAERSLAQTVQIIQQGRGQMPLFAGGLSQPEQQAVAAYVRSLSFASDARAQVDPTPETLPTQATAAPTTALATDAPATTAGTPSGSAATAEPALPLQAVIQGTVRNLSSSGKVPPGLSVTLKGFDGEEEVVSEQAQVDASGRFSFKDIEIVPGRLFFVVGEHLGLTYASEVAHLLPAQASLDLPIVIYDSTESTQELAIERLHTLFDFSIEGSVRVIELWILSNQGDQTIAPAEGIQVSLPVDATDVQFEGGAVGERFVLTESGFADMEPVSPGQGSGELVFSFSLPYERRLEFAQPVNYPVQAVILLSPEPGPKLQAEGLQEMGVREISTGVIRSYGLGPVAAGDAVQVTLSGRPAASTATGSLPPNLGIAIGLAAVGVALIAAGLLWFRPKRQPKVEAEPPAAADPEREGLLRAIARLDDDFEVGRIPEADYRERREALKRSLLAISGEGDGEAG
ncbi:MAG: c-type cytochrome [Anaerolineales bacterium]|nr:c-type cytochrome [Anaerolineales bacterium]